jgi:hypothetical protein
MFGGLVLQNIRVLLNSHSMQKKTKLKYEANEVQL